MKSREGGGGQDRLQQDKGRVEQSKAGKSGAGQDEARQSRVA